jgi:hypothetical protein
MSQRRGATAIDGFDTDLLRNPPWSDLGRVGQLLDVAAREIDRVRASSQAADADQSHLRAARDSLIDDINSLRTDRDFMVQKITQLRAVIDNAPHQLDCSMQTHAGGCDCWKAQVL